MLKFTTPPDYENPRDANKDNVYELTVTVTQGTNTDVQTVVVSVTGVDEVGTLEGLEAITHAENDTGTVATYTTSGPATATWTLDGADRGDFTITGGMLKFRSTPDFENPADAGTDNTYMVTVKAAAGGEEDSIDVTITVTDMDEAGTVTLSQQRKVGTAINATLSDGDGNTSGTTWQWAKSSTAADPSTTSAGPPTRATHRLRPT